MQNTLRGKPSIKTDVFIYLTVTGGMFAICLVNTVVYRKVIGNATYRNKFRKRKIRNSAQYMCSVF